MKLLSIAASALLLALSGPATAQIVVSEIHYHPVEEDAFNADGTPFLDLTDDVHEFVEIQNTGAASVNLGGWELSGAVDYTFPAGTSLAPGSVKVVAKNVSRLQTVYGISGVLGPYSGKLSNSGDTVRLKDVADSTVDSVTYSASFPWAMSADALGAQDRFTGLSSSSYQYKGRSLQRVSATANSNDPANWLASPLTGPSPGTAQTFIATPKPVVIAQARVQTSDGSSLILAGNATTVSCTFSSTADLSSVQLEWFIDNVDSTSEIRTTVTMTDLGGGNYTASIAGQTTRSIVRYRFLANRGSGSEVVSPRADDPAISQTGVSGARQPWHGYFVYPSSGRTSTLPIYDLFISTANLAVIKTYAQQNPARVTSATAAGQPRSIPYVSASAPLWDGTVPAVFSQGGVLYDVQIRFHGSRYHRSSNANGLTSFKLHFPEHQPFRDRSSWFITAHGTEFDEATKINRLLGLPASTTRSVSWYFNSNAVTTKLEQGEYDSDMLKTYHNLQQQLGAAEEANGELYKCVGNRDASQSNLEGPYTCGDEAPMLANANWTQLQRYDWTFSIQNNGWKGPVPIRNMVEGMWTARGDTPATRNFSSNPTQLANAKAWFAANFDIDTTLTSMAMLQWMAVWDDVAHNQFFWRRANGKWVRLGWDYDNVMNLGPSGGGPANVGLATQSIYNGEYGNVNFGTANWWKDSFFKCYRTEFNQRLWELNNSFFDPTNLTALGLTRAATFANSRRGNVNTALISLGTYQKPVRPTNASPATGGVVVGGASLTSSAYSSPNSKAHASTKWEIRNASGDYESPVLLKTSSENLTSLPIPFESLVYGQTYWWRVTHIDSDGHPSIISAETSFTWGTASTTAGTLVLNEILAVNRTTVENGGSYPDYIEIRNNGATAYDLTGVTLTDDPGAPAKFSFPSGNTLAAGGYLIIWCDKDSSAQGFHSGFNLSSAGQTVLMMSGSTILDSVSFGPQAPDLAIGRIVNGTGTWTANNPTPGLANDAKTLGSTSTLFINEWMASPDYGDDWFELYNSGSAPVDISLLYLSDNPSSPKLTRIPALSFIGAGGHTRFEADDSTAGANHCAFRLSAGGDNLVLTSSGGVTALRTVTFNSQAGDASEGYLPDGNTATLASFPVTASPDGPNWLSAPVVVNEVLARPGSGEADAFELHNPGASPVSVAGWWLSNDIRSPKKYQIGAGVTIAAGGYLVVDESDLAAGTVPFSLSAAGGEVCLSEASGGVLSGYRSQVSFGASASGTSFGRVAATGLANGSGGTEFWPLVQSTLNAVNAAPQVTPLIINEVMYHPEDAGDGSDVTATEFVEIHNPTNATVDLAGWQLKGASDYTFGSGVSLPASGYLLVVGFDPSSATALAEFRSFYGLTAETPIYGPFSANLPNSTAVLEIGKPDLIDGVVRYVTVDRVEYRDEAPWPVDPDGGGYTLQRISRSSIGNDAANWGSASPSPGAVNGGLFETLAIWTDSALPAATDGVAYSFQLTAVGGTAPYQWSVVSGSLPDGLSISNTGLISGTPETGSGATFTVRLAHAEAGTVQKSFTIPGAEDLTDADLDGMPDAWETQHSLELPDADEDHDGRSNLDEYVAGTDPGDPASRFGITVVSPAGASVISVTWPGVAGKSYRIYTSTNLSSWTPQPNAIPCTVSGPMQSTVNLSPERKGFVRIAIEP